MNKAARENWDRIFGKKEDWEESKEKSEEKPRLLRISEMMKAKELLDIINVDNKITK